MNDTVITLVINDYTRKILDQVLVSRRSTSYQGTIKKLILEYEKQYQTVIALTLFSSQQEDEIRQLKEEVRTLKSR